MFDNYRLGVQSTSTECEYGTDSAADISKSVADYIKKDKYGNIIGLCWPSDARFTISLTSDIWIPVAEDAVIFTQSGENPLNVIPTSGLYAYNTVDCLCWKYEADKWIEQYNIAEFKNSDNIVLFSKADCTTRVIIRNFRGESVVTLEGDSSVYIQVDDDLSDKLCQGFYNLDICRIVGDEVMHMRRIPLSIVQDNASDAHNTKDCQHRTVNINKSSYVTVEQHGTILGLLPAILEE